MEKTTFTVLQKSIEDGSSIIYELHESQISVRGNVSTVKIGFSDPFRFVYFIRLLLTFELRTIDLYNESHD